MPEALVRLFHKNTIKCFNKTFQAFEKQEILINKVTRKIA